MSAIAGIIHLDRRPADMAVLSRIGNVLTPYGPDRGDAWSERGAGLLHRLMRITPEDAFDHQPLTSRDGRWVLVADARIDNRDELAGILEIRSAEARAMADSAFILRALEKWGTAAPQHLLGDFAFAAWDRRAERLFLARDPLGFRPLYWYRSGKTIAFASLTKGLFSLPGVPREIDEGVFVARMARVPRLDDASLFREIQRVIPGHSIEFDQDGERTHRYHRFDPEARLHLAREEEYVERALALLEESVRCRLRSNGAIVSHLSSGLDSTTVTETAARLLRERGERLTAYTAVPRPGFDGPVMAGRHADERPGAAAVAARHANLEHVLVPNQGLSFLKDLAGRVERHGIPFPGPSNRGWAEAIQRDAANRGARVLLVGQRGNLTLSYHGLPRLPALIRRGELLRWLREAKALRCRQGNSWRSLLSLSLAPFAPEPLWRTVAARRGRLRTPLTFTPIHPDLVHRTRLRERFDETGADFSFRPWGNGWKMRVNILRRNDPGDMYSVTKGEYGLEQRDPMADLRLIEYCLSLPEEQFLSRGEPRRLIRRMMAGILPPEVLEARTRGLQSADWYEGLADAREEIGRWLERLAASPEIGRLLDLEELRRSLETLPDDGWGDGAIVQAYRKKLLFGLSEGAFLLHIYPHNH